MFLIDTNVVSELRKAKSGKADTNVIAWASAIPYGSLFISVITVLEAVVIASGDTAIPAGPPCGRPASPFHWSGSWSNPRVLIPE